jgi:hypothetical protein
MCFFAASQLKTATDQVPTFHGIKLGVSLGSQFQECPWNPPKKGDIPQYVSSPYKDERGNTIPCFHYLFGFDPAAAYPQEVSIELIEHITALKDDAGNVLDRKPFPGAPTVNISLLIPPSSQLVDGTIEEVSLTYDPVESDRVRDALIKKYGVSHPPEKKIDRKIFEELLGAKLISQDAWKTGWGELLLVVWNNSVIVTTKTQKQIRFEQDNKKDEF